MVSSQFTAQENQNRNAETLFKEKKEEEARYRSSETKIAHRINQLSIFPPDRSLSTGPMTSPLFGRIHWNQNLPLYKLLLNMEIYSTKANNSYRVKHLLN